MSDSARPSRDHSVPGSGTTLPKYFSGIFRQLYDRDRGLNLALREEQQQQQQQQHYHTETTATGIPICDRQHVVLSTTPPKDLPRIWTTSPAHSDSSTPPPTDRRFSLPGTPTSTPDRADKAAGTEDDWIQVGSWDE